MIKQQKISKEKLHFAFKKYKIILKHFAKNTLINFCVSSAYIWIYLVLYSKKEQSRLIFK